MPRNLQNLRKHAIGMLNADMIMNAVAMNTGCSTCAIRHLFKQQSIPKIDHVVDVHVSQLVAKTATF